MKRQSSKIFPLAIAVSKAGFLLQQQFMFMLQNPSFSPLRRMLGDLLVCRSDNLCFSREITRASSSSAPANCQLYSYFVRDNTRGGFRIVWNWNCSTWNALQWDWDSGLLQRIVLSIYSFSVCLPFWKSCSRLLQPLYLLTSLPRRKEFLW